MNLTFKNIKLNRKSKIILLIINVILAVSIIIGIYFCSQKNKVYYAENFGIETVLSDVDFNNNGVDDYTDIMLGARIDAENRPRYDGSYWEDGYPPEDIGVCTDVIWRAFKNAGYSLKDMVDNDISDNISLYPRVKGKSDPNIDFRRVPNLKVFFERFAISLTLDTSKTEEWQPGDIVTYISCRTGEEAHIAIISDKRNRKGIPFIIHNGGKTEYEENNLKIWNMEISGHFRFDAGRIDEDILVEFKDS